MGIFARRGRYGERIDGRTDLYDTIGMIGAEFVRRVERLGKVRGIPVRFAAHQGKGSHGRLYYGEHFTTPKDRKQEIGKGLLAAMLKQLGLNPNDLNR